MASYKNDIEHFDGKEIQTQYYVIHSMCAYPGCDVHLFWTAPGPEDDGGGCFFVDAQCSCEDEEKVRCCSRHINERDYFKCKECN